MYALHTCMQSIHCIQVVIRPQKNCYCCNKVNMQIWLLANNLFLVVCIVAIYIQCQNKDQPIYSLQPNTYQVIIYRHFLTPSCTRKQNIMVSIATPRRVVPLRITSLNRFNTHNNQVLVIPCHLNTTGQWSGEKIKVVFKGPVYLTWANLGCFILS